MAGGRSRSVGRALGVLIMIGAGGCAWPSVKTTSPPPGPAGAGRIEVFVNNDGAPYTGAPENNPNGTLVVVPINSSSGDGVWNNFGTDSYLRNGRYGVSVPSGGRYDVHVGEYHPENPTVNNLVFPAQLFYGVAPGANVHFELNRATGSISGTVLNRSGAPAAGVRVDAFDTQYCTPGWAQAYGWGSASTDGAGQFDIPRLLPGRAYTVFAHGPGFDWEVYAVPVQAGAATGGVTLSAGANGSEFRAPCT
ncbi:MAG: carboxypeptidase-like regulatory domain-containing protein [Acidimicrobiales bacterium]